MSTMSPGLYGDVRARTDGAAQVGLCQRRRVVDPGIDRDLRDLSLEIDICPDEPTGGLELLLNV